jgi:hypothetical protein
MTGFANASRPRLANGRACWMGTNRPLPWIHVMPASAGTDLVIVRVMIAEEWVVREWHVDQLGALMRLWAEDPEMTCRHGFGVEVPGDLAVADGEAPLSAEPIATSAADLGFT